jgi:hypothetical protein
MLFTENAANSSHHAHGNGAGWNRPDGLGVNCGSRDPVTIAAYPRANGA